jgi:hypothetical protein
MAGFRTDLDILLERGGEDKHPIFSFRWVCEVLPGHDNTYVETVNLPFPRFDKKSGWFGNGIFTYYPGFKDIDQFDLTIYEDTKCTTLKWLQNWKDAIAKDGVYGLPYQYKRDMSFVLLSTKGDAIMRAVLLGTWPEGTGAWDLNYEDARILKVTQTFSVDALALEFLV